LDEVDAYPYDLDGEGSPIELAIARTRTFAKRKIFIISTPTVDDNSAIQREFLKTDQHYYTVPCPHCGEYHVLIFENLKWDAGKPETAKMECPNCHELIEERYKTEIMSVGKWISAVPENSSRGMIGFHLSSFYSPYGWFSWGNIAASYEDAVKDPAKMKTFVNTILGEPLKESGEAPSWENIYNRREKYAQNLVKKEVCFITSGVDVQKDRLELEIVGWCADKSSYSIDYRVLLGNTSLPDVWNQLQNIVFETWEREDGVLLQVLRFAIDSGYNTSEVYSFCRRHFGGRVIAIKGQGHLGIPIAPPRQIDYNKNGKKIGRLKQWNVGVSMLKSELYSWLSIEPNTNETYPPCYCHFPQYDNRYFEGLTAEEWIPSKHQWVKRYERNEPLDCRIYARAAAIIVGLDRLKPHQLLELGAHFTASEKAAIEIKKPDKPKSESFWD
jgi:phage terminase large subunit GpA-like protein